VDVLFTWFNLLKGSSSETSGGIFTAMPADKAKEFCAKLEQLDGWPAWIIGKVVPAKDAKKNSAYIVPNPAIISV